MRQLSYCFVMGKLKTLASDTVVYGASTILSRLIGWLMMPLYVRVVSQTVYGTFSYVYSWIAIFLVVVTLGFETGYFRFATDDNRDRLLGTLSRAVGLFGLLGVLACAFFPSACCAALDFDFGPQSGVYLLIMAGIVLLDSYNAIFFAELRYLRKSLVYALLRLVQVLVNVLLTVVFLFWLRHCGGFWSGVDDITYMMLANLAGSLFSTLYFLPRVAAVVSQNDKALLRKALIYSLPLVGMGFFGQANTNIEKILIKHLDPSADPLASLGVYAACYKIGVLMSIFTQSFRMAFEPFFFKENKDKAKTDIYGPALKWFVYFGLLIFAAVMLAMPLLRLFLPESYYAGTAIIPWILVGQLFFGVYYSMSLWYKLTDRTYWGIIMSAIGLAVNTALNFVLIPRMGYMGAAISTFVGYAVMMLTSYFLGQRYFPVAYPVGRLLAVGAGVVGVVLLTVWLTGAFAPRLWAVTGTCAFAVIVALMARIEGINPRPVINKILRRK